MTLVECVVETDRLGKVARRIRLIFYTAIHGALITTAVILVWELKAVFGAQVQKSANNLAIDTSLIAKNGLTIAQTTVRKLVCSTKNTDSNKDDR